MPTFCDPCPGKMKAINGGVPPRRRDVLPDAFEETIGRQTVGHRDRVTHGLGARAPVADDRHARTPSSGAPPYSE